MTSSYAAYEVLAAPVAVIRGSRIVFANHALLELADQTFAALENTQPQLLFDPHSGAKFVLRAQQTIEARLSNGMWVEYTIAPLAGEWIISFHDITRQRLLEEALYDGEYLLRLLAEHISDLLSLYHLDGSMIYYSPSYERILEYHPHELNQLSITDLIHPDETPHMRQVIQQIIDGNTSITRLEYRIRSKSGIYLMMEAEITLINTTGDGEKMLLVSSRDVSERHRAQAALIEQGRLAAALQNERELSALKNQVMERISHEFRTPLAVIATAASLVQRYSNQMSEQRREEHLGTIQQQVEHLSEVLTDILRVMKGNEYPVYRVVVPLEPLLQTLVASFRAKHPERHIQYHNASVLAEGRIDPDLLQDIVEPLLTNALKYSDTASSISLSAERQQNMLILHIRDQGIGIPMPDQAHVTQAFFRASNIDERSGLGLGLRIAKDAAQRLGGTLEIQSVEGAGTTVTVRLPLSD